MTCDGVPKVGQLMKAAWSLNDTCRFKIKLPGVRCVSRSLHARVAHMADVVYACTSAAYRCGLTSCLLAHRLHIDVGRSRIAR